MRDELKEIDSLLSLVIRGIDEHLAEDEIDQDYIIGALDNISYQLHNLATRDE